jgi:hypothetical protein
VLPSHHVCEHTFVTSDGSAYTRLRLALQNGNLLAVRANAAELRRVSLTDALAILELIHAKVAATPSRSPATTGISGHVH